MFEFPYCQFCGRKGVGETPEEQWDDTILHEKLVHPQELKDKELHRRC